MGENPFADLIPQRGSEQGGVINLPVASPTPVTTYSIPASVGGSDEAYDSGTAQGYGSLDNELAPGVVAVNPSVYPIGTIFKDSDTGEAFVAGDKHGNANPNVVDIYTPPSQYTGFSGQRNLVPIGSVPANEIPKTATGVGELLKNFGKVPEGEGAYTSLGKIQQGLQPQQQQMENPFADLIPKSDAAPQSMGSSFSSDQSSNPFADLIPAKSSSSFGSPAVSSGQAQTFGDKGVGYEEKPDVGYLELAGRGLTGAAAKANELMAQGLGIFPYVEDKTLQAFGVNSDIYNRYMKAVHATGLGQPGVEAAQIKPTEKLPPLGEAVYATAEMAGTLPYMMMTGGIGAEEAAANEAFQAVKPLMPRITQGIQSMTIPAGEAGMDAVKESSAKGDNQITQAAKGMAMATTTAVMGAVPLSMQSKIANPLYRFLEQGAYGYLTGIPVGEAQKQVSSWVNGQPYVPSTFKEMAIQAIPMGLMTGTFGVLHAPAENKILGGPAPEVKPSANPIVNEREAQITAAADAQSPILPEAPKPAEEAPAPTVEATVTEEAPAPAVETPAAEPSKEQKLDQLFSQLWMHPERSPKHTAIQEQIDALNKPAEESAKPTEPNAVQENLTQAKGGVGLGNAQPNANQNIVPERSQAEQGINREATPDNVAATQGGISQASDAWLKGIEGNDPQAVANAEKELSRTQEGIQELQRLKVLADYDNARLSLRASGDYGTSARQAATQERTRSSQERGRVGQPSGEPTSSEQRGTQQTALLGESSKNKEPIVGKSKQTSARNLVDEIFRLRSMQDEELATQRERDLQQMLASATQEEKETIKKYIKDKYNGTLQIETSRALGVRNAPAVGERVGAENQAEVPAEKGEEKPQEEVVSLFDANTPEQVDAWKKRRLDQNKASGANSQEKASNAKRINMQAFARKKEIAKQPPVTIAEAPATEKVTQEAKPEKVAPQAEAPKEEVKPEEVKSELPEDVQNEFLSFARKKGGLNKTQARKALAEYEKAGNIQVGEDGKMLFSNAEGSSRQALRKAAGIEEVTPVSPAQSMRDVIRRFQSGEEDSIDTLKGLGEEVRKVANKTKNKFLSDLASEIEDAVDHGVEIEDAEDLVNRSLSELEREAGKLEAPKEKKTTIPKRKTNRDKATEVFGPMADELRDVWEQKILDPREYQRRVKAGIIKKGGEYDFLKTYKFPKKVRDLIFSKTGEKIDNIATTLGLDKPDQIWAKIDEAIRTAEKIQEEEKAQAKLEHDALENAKRIKELEKTDPEAAAIEAEKDVRSYLLNRMKNEGGYFELPQIIYDAAVSVGRSVGKVARDFKSWAGEMTSRLGDGIKNYLRRIWNSYKQSRFASESGAVDLRGDERFKPKELNEREKTAKTIYDNYVKQFGKPPTQELIGNILSQKYPGITSEQISDIYNTATGKPKPSIAEAKPPVSSEATPEQPATSLKNAYSEAEAKALGFQELTQQDAQEMDAAMDRAKKESVEDPLAGQRLAQSLITNPKRSLTGDESALLLKHKTDLFNSLNRMAEGLTEGSPEQKFEKSLAYDNASRSYYDLLQALKDRGSEWGREGRWRQALLREDYSFATQERLAKSAKREPLTDKEKTELAKQTKRLTEIDKEILETQEKEANQQEQKSIEKELKKSPQYDPYIQSLVDRVRKNVSSAADSARERIRQRRAEGRLFTGVDPTDIADYAVIGADHLLKGVTQFGEWSNRMREEFGEAIRPYLNDIFKKSQEFNEKQFDKEAKGSGSVKKRIARASSPEERTRKVQETRARNRLEELKKEEERQKNGDFSKPLKKAPVEPSAETKRLREEAAKIKDRINERRAKWEKANRTKIEKVLGGISALNRFNILSHITVLEHLAGAAVENIATRPISSTLAQVMRFNKTLNDIRKKAVYEGGFSARSELKGVYGIAKSAKDVWSKLLKGKASIDWLYGKQYNTAPQFVKMVENVHGAMKEPVRQGIFSRSLQLRIEAAKEMGLDPTHDEVLYNSLASEALNDANMDIFMGDNFLTSGIRGMIRGFERNTESPRLAKFISTLLDLAMPIMNVPTNIAIRKLRLGFGLLEAPTRIAIAAKEGKLANRADKLSRDEAEKITRAFKYGTLGLLLGIYAWRNSSQFGGLYNAVGPQAPENPELKKGEVKLLGLKFPKAISHGPVASFMNMIADSRRLYDKSVRNNSNSKWSQLSEPTFFSLFVSGLGSLPPAQAATRYFSPFTTGGQKVGQALRDMLIPGAVQDIAGKMDTESQPKNFIDFLEGEPIKRSAKTFEQELMKGIPVIRETLPKSKQKKSGGSSSASSRGNQ